MKTLYIECGMGAAGDMLMAALLGLVDDQEGFIKNINAIGLPGVQVHMRQAQKCGITGIGIDVLVNGQEEHSHDLYDAPHGHTHLDGHEIYHHETHKHAHLDGHEIDHLHHASGESHSHGEPHHAHADMDAIKKIIDSLHVPAHVKTGALDVYQLIAEAESRVHGKPVSQVHFHEVGAMDAVADIVGVCMLVEQLAPGRIEASPINTGSGHVRCAHGVLPVPAPATELILRGVPSYSDGTEGELCTPTGAAILKHFASAFGPRPVMQVERTGYGMGKKEFTKANTVRAFWGETETGEKTRVAEISCNLDDMTGEQIGFAAETLLAEGALDVYTTPIQMKKGRPGFLLCCLCAVNEVEKFAQLMLRHTSTFGVRVATFDRYCLDRRCETVQTRYGEISVKHGQGHGVTKCKAEYEDVKNAAQKSGATLEAVYREALKSD